MDKKNKPTILSYPCGQNQSGFWRIFWPAYQMQVREFANYNISMVYLRDSLTYKKSDVVQIQRVTDKQSADYIEKLCTLKEKLNFRLVYDIDDVLINEDLPDYNAVYNSGMLNKVEMEKVINLCDEITVSTPFLKEYYLSKFNQQNITVIPNKIPFFWAGNYYDDAIRLEVYRKNKKRPRILYAGGFSHINKDGKTGNDDFSHVINSIKQTIKEFHWIFLGVLPWELAENNQAGEVEFYGLENLDNYHKRIMVLNCSMMIVPLADNIFNHAKSDIKYQEACAHGLPIACQDITPYKSAPIRFSSGEQMIDVIRKTLATEETYIEASRNARKKIDKNWLELEENISMHKELFSYPYQDKKRKILNKINEVSV